MKINKIHLSSAGQIFENMQRVTKFIPILENKLEDDETCIIACSHQFHSIRSCTYLYLTAKRNLDF